jgi:hypothetical protein
MCGTVLFATGGMLLDIGFLLWKGWPTDLEATGNRIILGLWGAMYFWPALLSLAHVYQMLHHSGSWERFCLVTFDLLGDHHWHMANVPGPGGYITWLLAFLTSATLTVAIGVGRLLAVVLLNTYLLQSRLILEPTAAACVYWLVTGAGLDVEENDHHGTLELIMVECSTMQLLFEVSRSGAEALQRSASRLADGS